MVIAERNSIDQTPATPTRTAQTVIAYRRRVIALLRQATKERRQKTTLPELVRWFCDQNGRWSPATIRLYRAALADVLRDAAVADASSAALFEAMLQKIVVDAPRAKPRREAKRTSARKRTSMRYDELTQLRDTLHDGDRLDRLAAAFLWLNAHVGLRPVEWLGAELAGSNLHVRCAKNTNGRGLADVRPLDLKSAELVSPGFIASVGRLLEDLQRATAHAGGHDILWQRLRTRIARACRRAKIRRIAPYTTRHVGLATAKQTLSIEEVAAIAGHKTTRTTVSRYARRSTGLALHLGQVRPDPELVRRVIRSAKETRKVANELVAQPPSPKMTPW